MVCSITGVPPILDFTYTHVAASDEPDYRRRRKFFLQDSR
jgi:hypothetical protein